MIEWRPFGHVAIAHHSA